MLQSIDQHSKAQDYMRGRRYVAWKPKGLTKSGIVIALHIINLQVKLPRDCGHSSEIKAKRLFASGKQWNLLENLTMGP